MHSIIRHSMEEQCALRCARCDGNMGATVSLSMERVTITSLSLSTCTCNTILYRGYIVLQYEGYFCLFSGPCGGYFQLREEMILHSIYE